MAEQVRAIRTRQSILAAAAKIFEEHGYQAATISQILREAGVTKGALYFHFQSKEDLAQGVLAEQDQRLIVPDRASKVQEIVDVLVLHAHRLQTDPMVRAGVRLSMDQLAQGLDRSGPFLRWGEVGCALLQKAQAQGELLPHVVPSETADVIVGSFAGIQSMSQAICDYGDLVVRVSALLRHLLPSVVVPSVLASLDLTETRGASVYAEALKAADELESMGAIA
ncbi:MULTISPECIES: ScbR family autoregulator-binding transcription factor [unclassified Streptomyces]|uniref:ScbR family autoregulator-binding transcription factor n=1 Tax=unclassified Streptomyces TaxID=2593676 RepID=UPI00224CAC89|nr:MULTISPECIES: ScbR family autoregulator-binding transcription factor [unclassified Streptomyces]MCX4633226.1 ScbR family autoregulator-binding transcription factor [Streptomyces sp. NBC_01443]WSW49528.1 TetR/AcrR family transcriptional regulator [Streptomyces sp. NBC_01001]